LRRGSNGEAVKELQTLLGLVADGSFGPRTEAAVRAAQRSLNLVPDGIVGPKTWIAFDGSTPAALQSAAETAVAASVAAAESDG
jgi:peptidoglycan hydrolase-like protein with peptidoglycan-binding domain